MSAYHFTRQPIGLSPPRTMDTPAARVSRSPANDMATTFIEEHTVVNDCVPLLDECPICLDNYSTEAAIRIIGIDGCSHQIGLTCLQDMLRSHPNEEKKCPLCRTTWIAAPAAPARRVQQFSMSRRMAGMFDGLDGIGENIASQVGADIADHRTPANPTATGNGVTSQNSQGLVSLITRNQNQRDATIHNPILLDSDSEDGDYETQRENFEQFTRDIESIRTRARNTQLSRSLRRREYHQHRRNASDTAGQPLNNGNDRIAAVGRPNYNPPAGAASSNFFNRSMNPFRPGASDFVPPLSMDAVTNRDRYRLHPRRSSPAQQANVDLTHVSPSSSYIIERPQVHLQSVRDAVLTRQLEQREKELNDRETRLNEREAALLQRETDLAVRERRAEQLVNIASEHQRETENLFRKQREDFERVTQ